MTNKDNSVASLNLKKYKEFLIKVKGYYPTGPVIKTMIDPLREFLSLNARETDKEQPKKIKIECYDSIEHYLESHGELNLKNANISIKLTPNCYGEVKIRATNKYRDIIINEEF